MLGLLLWVSTQAPGRSNYSTNVAPFRGTPNQARIHLWLARWCWINTADSQEWPIPPRPEIFLNRGFIVLSFTISLRTELRILVSTCQLICGVHDVMKVISHTGFSHSGVSPLLPISFVGLYGDDADEISIHIDLRPQFASSFYRTFHKSLLALITTPIVTYFRAPAHRGLAHTTP